MLAINNNIQFSSTPDPYWILSSPGKNYPSLERDLSVDVAIIGGGLVGITAAYLLSQEGLKTTVLEAGNILQGTTGHTTAKITSQHNLIYARLIKEYGQELAWQYANANQQAIDTIHTICKDNNIQCDFQWRPAYVYTQDEKYIKQLEDEAEAAANLGIKASCSQESPLPFKVKAALRFEDQAQFHPLKYLRVLAEMATNNDCTIFENTAIVDIEKTPPYVVVSRNGKKIKANHVIIATHYPFFDGGGLYFTKMFQERSYVTAVRIEEPFPEGMFINAEEPTRSLRSQPDEEGELVLIGGEHHKTGHDTNTNDHYDNLITFANDNFPVKEIAYRWSTQDCMTMDGLPYAGNLTTRSPHLYLATGFGKWGMTNGTASAMILKDLIVEGDSPWAQIYNPARSITINAAKRLFKENLDVGINYFGGKIQPMVDNAEIPRGSARVIEVDGNKLGAFRDDEGNLHIVDTTCTHLGCELQWNIAERTWDCPCHGSRFSFEGKIIEGPAIKYLHHEHEGDNQVEAKIFS